MASPYPPMILSDTFAETRNLAWRMEPGRKDPNNPLMSPKFPWDSGCVFSHGTTLIDPIDGLWKSWYLSTPKECHQWRQLTYAYSEDGVNWVRPELDAYPFPGYERTNILFGSKMGGITSQVSVFVHPDAEPDRRYELFAYRDPFYHNPKSGPYSCPDKKIEGVPPAPGYTHNLYGLYRHFSSDGIHWRVEGDPIAGDPRCQQAYGGKPFVSSDGLAVFQLRDGRYVCHNKVQLPAPPGAYVTYDVGCGECRTIARRESADGWDWSHTYVNVLTPDYRDMQDTQFMELMMNEYNDGFIAVATVYHALEQTVDLQLAGSVDGKKWIRPVRRPAVSLEPLGDVGGGMLFPQRGFVIDGDQAHIYYSGVKGLHGCPTERDRNDGGFEGAFCRASWELGRMWAAVNFNGNEQEAWITTPPAECGGKTLFINAKTRNHGKVEAELLSGSRWQVGEALPGYSRAECNAFSGDDKCAPLTWGDRSKASVQSACLRLVLTDAFLYGYEWR